MSRTFCTKKTNDIWSRFGKGGTEFWDLGEGKIECKRLRDPALYILAARIGWTVIILSFCIWFCCPLLTVAFQCSFPFTLCGVAQPCYLWSFSFLVPDEIPWIMSFSKQLHLFGFPLLLTIVSYYSDWNSTFMTLCFWFTEDIFHLDDPDEYSLMTAWW